MTASPPEPSSPRPSGAARLVDALGGTDDLRFFRAPGRVNLMGDHTDYNESVQMTYLAERPEA